MVGGIEDVEIISIDVLVWAIARERHHHVRKDANAVVVTGRDERAQIPVSRRRAVPKWKAEVEIGGEKICRGVAPFTHNGAVLWR